MKNKNRSNRPVNPLADLYATVKEIDDLRADLAPYVDKRWPEVADERQQLALRRKDVVATILALGGEVA